MKKLLLNLLLFTCISAYSQSQKLLSKQTKTQPNTSTTSNPFQKKFPLIERYIDSFMKDWNIPGLAIAIVYKDRLLYAKGFGFRDVENKLPFDTKTQFLMASNTKTFIAMAACMLAEEGKLSLDKPVRNYMPSLNFSTDELNAKVTLRDMLSHRTGLQADDGIWSGSRLRPVEVASKAVYLQPVSGFREGFIYNNIMYISAAAVMEKTAGMRWEEIIQTRIFRPLQMSASHSSHEELAQSRNFAHGYVERAGSQTLQRITHRTTSTAAGPTGGIMSNIEDITNWMIALLNEGKLNGRQVLPASAILQTLVPNIIMEKEANWPELSHPLYGLARIMQTYKGYKVAWHTGAAPDGYCSNLTLVPSENLAVFMVHNSSRAAIMRRVMAYPIIDRLLGLSNTTWSERYMKEYVETETFEARRRDAVKAAQVKNTTPSHPLKHYTGKYRSAIYGDLSIELENDSLVFWFRDVKQPLDHFHYDQFVAREQLPGRPNRMHFLTNNKGEIDRFVSRNDVEFVKMHK